jgi:hypothetical protein
LAYEVFLVPSVRATVKGLSRAERRSYDTAVQALKGEGCKAGGKRLAATSEGDFAMCQRSLLRAWRLTTVYRPDASIVIVSLAKHTDRQNPTAALAEVFPGLSERGRRRSDQPPCCDDAQIPPTLSADLERVLFDVFGV